MGRADPIPALVRVLRPAARARAPALLTCADPTTAPVVGLLAAARRLPNCHAPARLPCAGGLAPCRRHPYCRCAARDAALRWHAGWRLSARWTGRGWRGQKFPSHRAFTAAASLTSPALAPVHRWIGLLRREYSEPRRGLEPHSHPLTERGIIRTLEGRPAPVAWPGVCMAERSIPG